MSAQTKPVRCVESRTVAPARARHAWPPRPRVRHAPVQVVGASRKEILAAVSGRSMRAQRTRDARQRASLSLHGAWIVVSSALDRRLRDPPLSGPRTNRISPIRNQLIIIRARGADKTERKRLFSMQAGKCPYAGPSRPLSRARASHQSVLHGCRNGLSVDMRAERRRCARQPAASARPGAPDPCWSGKVRSLGNSRR
jgi:hypothetical protein